MMNMGTMSGGWTMMAGMAAFWLVVIALLIWGAVRLMSARPQSGRTRRKSSIVDSRPGR